MGQLTLFPEDCRALIIEPEPIQAMTLELLLQDLGCRRMGPAGSLAETEELLAKRRPSFALVDVGLEDELEPVSKILERKGVPFAFLAVGPTSEMLDQNETLRHRPRILRPYHGPTLQVAACALYQDHLRNALAVADRRIAEGQENLARQLKLVERMAAAGHDTASAEKLAREYGRFLRTMRSSRELLVRRLDSFSQQPRPAQ